MQFDGVVTTFIWRPSFPYSDTCKFIGSIPSSFGNLSELEYLDVTINPFNILPISSLSWIWKLNKLTKLGLQMMKLTSEILFSVGNLSQLVTLCMRGNRLSGQIPPQIANLTKLTTLILHQNQLSGFILSEFINMSQFVVISLSINQLQGQKPPINLPTLKS